MPNFITKADYAPLITELNLEDMIEGNDTILEEAETDAIAIISDALFQKFDTDAIFATTGNERPRIILIYARNLVLNELFSRLPHFDIPKSVETRTNYTLKRLAEFEKGNKALSQFRLADESEKAVTTRVFYSQPKRSH